MILGGALLLGAGGCCCTAAAGPMEAARAAVSSPEAMGMAAMVGPAALMAPVVEGLDFASTPPAVLAASTDTVTDALFRNVNFHVAPGVVLEIRQLRGAMLSRTPGTPVVFDDKRAFTIRIDTAEVALDTASLAHLMNKHVFAYAGAPLRNLSFGTKNGELVQRGVMHKGIDIPFQMTAQVRVTSEGLLRIHPTAVRIGSLNGLGLMNALGLTLGSLLDLRHAVGVRVDGNDLVLDPERILPPPAISGRVVAVRVEPGRLVQIFGSSAPASGTSDANTVTAAARDLAPPDTAAPNYMYFRHGTLRFGKLFMVRADMQIVDLDPATPFDFSIDQYNTQLVAGYSKNRPDMGLEVFMPDLATALREQPPTRTAARTAIRTAIRTARGAP